MRHVKKLPRLAPLAPPSVTCGMSYCSRPASWYRTVGTERRTRLLRCEPCKRASEAGGWKRLVNFGGSA